MQTPTETKTIAFYIRQYRNEGNIYIFTFNILVVAKLETFGCRKGNLPVR